MTLTKRALIWTAFLGLAVLMLLLVLTIEAEAEARWVGAWGSGSRDASYRKNEGCYRQFSESHECQGPGLVRAPAHLLLDATILCIAGYETAGEANPYGAVNRQGSSASGFLQILRSTWHGEGFAARYQADEARLAAVEEQWEAGTILLIRYGLRPWHASGADVGCKDV